MPLSTLRELNPALRRPVWNGTKYIPEGYSLRVPARVAPERFLAAVPEGQRQDKQKLSTVVRVARGDSLYSIGRRLGVSWRDIARANNISSYRRLMPGQKLIIPYKGVPLPERPEPPKLQTVSLDPEEAKARKARLEELLEAVENGEHGQIKNGLTSTTRFQDLKVVRYDPEERIGEITTAYGETLGHYSDWADVATQEIRRLNGFSYRTPLRPGQPLLVPLHRVRPEEFDEKRLLFHLERVEDFFSEFNITEVVKVRVQRGQSPWDIAQNNNVPMWLFYRENPHVLSEGLRPGMHVTLPVVRQTARN